VIGLLWLIPAIPFRECAAAPAVRRVSRKAARRWGWDSIGLSALFRNSGGGGVS
jgi:hypothetical protein